MNQLKIKLNDLTKYIVIISFFIAIMYLASSILIPLSFSLILALLLYPICSIFERKLSRIWAIIVTFFGVTLLISGIIFFFGSLFYGLFENIKDFGLNLQSLIDRVINLMDQALVRSGIDLKQMVANESGNIIGSSDIIKKTISTSTGFLFSTALVFVYTFLFLLYRTSFKKLILYHFRSRKITQVTETLYKIQKVVQNYFFGLFIIILIVGTLNGLGLMMFGLDYPFLFGYFAAFLAIIPYIGTFIGGLLPFLYALLNYDNIWISVLVVLWYIIIQLLEGNILSPNIVGSKVSLNPLIALLAILFGGLIWGIAGMILFIPFMAIVKVIFDIIDPFKPYGLLLGSNFGNDELPLLKKLSKKIENTIDDKE